MSIFGRKSDHRAFGASDGFSEGSSASGEGGLQKQAGNLLCDRDCNAAFASRISAGSAEGTSGGARATELPLEKMAHNADGEVLKGMNASAEQTAMMLDMNPTADLYAHLEKIDQQAAVDLAVKDQRVERLALDSDNLAVKDEVKQRRYAVSAS